MPSDDVAMAGEAVDRTIEHVVTIMNILRCERFFKDNVLLKILQSRGLFQFFNDPPAVGGKHF